MHPKPCQASKFPVVLVWHLSFRDPNLLRAIHGMNNILGHPNRPVPSICSPPHDMSHHLTILLLFKYVVVALLLVLVSGLGVHVWSLQVLVQVLCCLYQSPKHYIEIWHERRFSLHLEFGKDLRNVRFALSTDEMNPFGERTSTHSTWPVILMMYNLPTWLCQKRKYLLLSILIQGHKHPGINIDVFHEPLMQEMETLWKEGIDMFGGFTR